jgi:hypothetical protein
MIAKGFNPEKGIKPFAIMKSAPGREPRAGLQRLKARATHDNCLPMLGQEPVRSSQPAMLRARVGIGSEP